MKIVVRGTNWIGDAIMSIPAMREIRRIFSGAHIALHTRRWAEGIFRDAGFIDEIIPFDQTGSKTKVALIESTRLRRERFDLAIVLPNSFDSAVTVWTARVPRRFGYSTDARSSLLTDAIEVPTWKNDRHEVYYYLNLIEAVERQMLGSDSVSRSEPMTSLEVSKERRALARTSLALEGVVDGKQIVGLGVGSTNSMAKRWPAKNYSALNDRLQREVDANVILLGSTKESGVAARVASGSATSPIDITGKTNLADAVAILRELDLFVSNDMGLAHVSAAVGTPTIVIFGPTNPETTRPFAKHARVLREPVDCSPCMLRECPIDHRCMTRITVDRVFESVMEILTQNSTIQC